MASAPLQWWTLARLTALETMRQPFCLLLTLGSLTFTALLPLLLTHTLGHGEKLVRDSALAVHLCSGLILSSYAACASLHRDIRRGGAAAVLSKPVDRAVFFLAKYAGICLVLALLSAAATLTALLSVRTVRDPFILDLWSGLGMPAALAASVTLAGGINYRFRKPFPSTGFSCCLTGVAVAFICINWIGPDGAPAPFGSRLDLALIPVSGLIFLALLVFAALSVALATRLDAAATLSLCGLTLVLGLMSEALAARAAAVSPWAARWIDLLPNWQHFWAADALTRGEPVGREYLWNAAHYAACYAGALLCLGLVGFRHRDLRL